MKLRIGILIGSKKKEKSISEELEKLKELMTEYALNAEVFNIYQCYRENPDKKSREESIQKFAHEVNGTRVLITRPNWGSVLRESKELPYLPENLIIATLSSGTNHIDVDSLTIKEKNITVLSSEGGNSEATAEYTLWLAITMRRLLHLRLMEMAFGLSEGKSYWPREIYGGFNYGSLVAVNIWTIVGTGFIPARLIPRLFGAGINRVIVWSRDSELESFFSTNNNRNEAKWAKFVEKLPWEIDAFEEIKVNEFPVDLSTLKQVKIFKLRGWQTPKFIIVTNNLPAASSMSDVVSVHLPSDRERGAPSDCTSGNLGGTIGIISRERMPIPETGLILNIGRGDLVNDDFARHYRINNDSESRDPKTSSKIYNFGADVLPSEFEKETQQITLQDKDPLWEAFSWSMLTSMYLAVTRLGNEVAELCRQEKNESSILKENPLIRKMFDRCGPLIDALGAFPELICPNFKRTDKALDEDEENSKYIITEQSIPRIVLSPHVAGETPDATKAIAQDIIEQIKGHLEKHKNS